MEASLDGDGPHRDVRLVLGMGLVSSVLYAVVYLAQREIFRNGLLLRVPGATLPSHTHLLLQCVGYYGGTIALFALYAWLIALCRGSYFRSPQARRLALLFPVLFNLAWLFGRPFLSRDIYAYMTQGVWFSTHGGSLHLRAAGATDGSALTSQLAAYGWRLDVLNPYGPLWNDFALAVMRLTHDIFTAMLLFKALVVIASLGSTVLIWLILGRTRPKDQLLGTLVFAWNPMVIVELAGEGHNDAFMIVFVLAALFFSVRGRTTTGLLALALGVLAKYLPLILLPAQLAYFWRTQRNRSQLVRQLVLGALIALCLAVILYRPIWAGLETFSGLRDKGQMGAQPSAWGVLFWFLSHALSQATATSVTMAVVTGLFALYVLVATWRVHDIESLFAACSRIALAYVLFASPIYWPWYVALPVALLALSPSAASWQIILVLSLCSRLVAPLDDMYLNTFISAKILLVSTFALGVALPGVAILLTSVQRTARLKGRIAMMVGQGVEP